MNTAKKLAPKKVVTGEVRGSYVHVFKAKINSMSGNEEFSMQIIIPKTDVGTVAKIEGAIETATFEKFAGKVPAKFRTPLRDGDSPDEDNKAAKGCFFMNIKNREAPGIIDVDKNEIIDTREFVSGDYCRVSMNAYAYDKSGNRGVSFGLNNVQMLRKGEPLGGRNRAEDDFDVVEAANDSDDWDS